MDDYESGVLASRVAAVGHEGSDPWTLERRHGLVWHKYDHHIRVSTNISAHGFVSEREHIDVQRADAVVYVVDSSSRCSLLEVRWKGEKKDETELRCLMTLV